MAVEIGWQRKLVTGAPGEKKFTTLLAVNEDLGVPTHSQHPSADLRRGVVGTNIRASSRVKHCEPAVRRTSKQERWVKTLVK